MTKKLNETANLVKARVSERLHFPYTSVLITGASRGIGRALSIEIARVKPSVKLALMARGESDLQSVADEAHAFGAQASIYVTDVADPIQVEKTITQVDDTCGGLDLVIANAGVSGRCESSALQWNKYQAIVDVNVRGAAATLSAVLPRMVERGHGHIVGISSLAQYRGLPKRAAYSASKAFLSTFLESLRVDLHETGVYVTDIRPGFIRTDMTSKNTSWMPFLMDVDKATSCILKGIAARKAVVAFPWPMATLLRVLRLLPTTIYDPIARTII